MTEYRKIDLHLHTNISDGTNSPEELLAKVKEAGIDLFSVTDHDAVSACRIIREILPPDGPAFLTGVEFSCRDKDEDKGEENKYHILGYGFDPDEERFAEVLKKGSNVRVKKMEARLEHLKADGYSFSPEDERALFAHEKPGKPHLADLMVKCGYNQGDYQANMDILNEIKLPIDLYLSPKEAIEGILAAGGIPVLAHPVLGSGSEEIKEKKLVDRLQKLKDFGLQGIEGFYQTFEEDQRTEVLDLADRLKLYVTAGSDYHGLTKEEFKLGVTGLADASEGPDGLRRFLEDVSELIVL